MLTATPLLMLTPIVTGNHQEWMNYDMDTKVFLLYHTSFINIPIYVTEFEKKGLIHASNFSTLRMCNSASIGPTTLIFGSKSFLSLY